MIRTVVCPQCGREMLSYPVLEPFLCEPCRKTHDPICEAWQRFAGRPCTCAHIDGPQGGS